MKMVLNKYLRILYVHGKRDGSLEETLESAIYQQQLGQQHETISKQ